MKQIILKAVGLLVIVAIGFLLYFSVIEGFQGIRNKDIGSIPDINFTEVCRAKTKCGECLSTITMQDAYGVKRTYDCGWCPESNACIPRVSTYRIIPKWLTDMGGDCSAKTFVTRAQECPDALCSSLTNCRDCAGSIRCGWSADSNTCLSRVSPPSGSGGTGGSSGSGGSPPPPPPILITSSGSCPAIDCSTITDCATCTNTTGCGYCKSTKGCVTLDKFGVPPPLTCTQDTVLTGPYQCPGATPSSLSAPLDTRTAPDPTDAQLASAQSNWYSPRTMDMTQAPAEITKSPVSPARTYQYAGGARKYGESSIPATVRFDPKLGDAPLESYVKMLVNSQLAAQGVPTNEPFQVNETEAIGNAEEYMHKAFKKIFSSKP